MKEWFLSLDSTAQVSIITGLAVPVVGSIGKLIYDLLKKEHNSTNSTNIKQKQGIGSKGSQIGIQNNYDNKTIVNFEDPTINNSSVIINGNNAPENDAKSK